MNECGMWDCRENVCCQAMILGEGMHRCVCGCVRFCRLECGTVMQAHIRNLPESGFFSLQIENGGCCFSLPPLLSCGGEALMSVCVGCLSAQQICGGTIVISAQGCTGCPCRRIACGRLLPCAAHGCRCMDPRPLFASSIRC